MRLNRAMLFFLLLCVAYPMALNAGQLEDGLATMESGDYTLAHDLLYPLAEEGDAEAQNAIGAMYLNGQGVEKDPQKGLAYIVKAAKQGNAVAQQNAYLLYYEEAQEGNIPAYHNVAYMCLKGWSGEADPYDCAKLLETAAQSGYAKSAAALATIYEKGKYGIDPDEEKAEYWKNFEADPPEAKQKRRR